MIIPQIRLPHPLVQYPQIAGFAADIAALAARVTTLERLTVARVGIRKTTAQSLGSLGTTWVTIANYDTPVFVTPIGGSFSLANGSISVTTADDYIYTTTVEFACTSDNNSSRKIELRFFNLTDNVPIANANVFLYVGAYAEGVASSFSIPVNVSALVNKAICMQIRGAQNFAGAQVLGAAFNTVSIDPIVEVP